MVLLSEQFYQMPTHFELVPFWKTKLLEAESSDLRISVSSLGNMASFFQTNVFCLYLEGANRDGHKWGHL